MTYTNRDRKFRLRIKASLLGCAVSALTLTASAGVGYGTFYPAGFCFAEGPNSLDRINYESGLVNNEGGSGTADIMCPIKVGPEYSFPNTELLYVDNSSSTNLTCTHSWNDDDGDPFWSWTFNSSGSSTVLRRFVVSETDTGFYRKNWRCVLPASTKVSITGYFYDADFREPG